MDRSGGHRQGRFKRLMFLASVAVRVDLNVHDLFTTCLRRHINTITLMKAIDRGTRRNLSRLPLITTYDLIRQGW